MTPQDLDVLRKACVILERYRLDIGTEGYVIGLGRHLATARDDIDHHSVALLISGEVFSGAAVDLRSAVAIARDKHRLVKESRTKARRENREHPTRDLTPHDRAYTALT